MSNVPLPIATSLKQRCYLVSLGKQFLPKLFLLRLRLGGTVRCLSGPHGLPVINPCSENEPLAEPATTSERERRRAMQNNSEKTFPRGSLNQRGPNTLLTTIASAAPESLSLTSSRYSKDIQQVGRAMMRRGATSLDCLSVVDCTISVCPADKESRTRN